MDTNCEPTIIVGNRLVKGRVHCASCGRFVNGNVFVLSEDEETNFVCNVQHGLNYITKRQSENREMIGPLAQLAEQLTLNQPFFKKPLDKILPKSLHLGDSFLGGKFNVDTKSNQSRLLNKKGGESHEDTGGNN